MFPKRPLLVLAVVLSPGSCFVTRVPSSSLAARGPLRRKHSVGSCRCALRYGIENGIENNVGMIAAGIDALSVTEIEKMLSERGIDFRDCSERGDLVGRLLQFEAAGNKGRADGEETRRQTSGGDFVNNSNDRSVLTDEERGVIGTFQRVSQSVAFILTTAIVQQRKGLQVQGAEVPRGTGSGFLWDDEGHVVTNYHVLVGGGSGGDDDIPRRVRVKLGGMLESREADVVGTEPGKEIAVLRLRDASDLPRPVDVGISSDLRVGQSVLAIGNPYGLDNTLTTGVVSALGRDVNGSVGIPIRNCVQTDAAINPGNSGGPLLNSNGRLIGVNTCFVSPGGAVTGSVGIGFAIPVDTVRRVVNQLIRYGRVEKPTLGITVANDRFLRSVESQLRRPLDGVLIAGVVPDGPASNVGLIPTTQSPDGSIVLGDLIISVDGDVVKQTDDLILAIEQRRAGHVVALRVMKRTDPSTIDTVRIKLTNGDDGKNSNKNDNSSNNKNNDRVNGSNKNGDAANRTMRSRAKSFFGSWR